jgi:hypothetical protein
MKIAGGSGGPVRIVALVPTASGRQTREGLQEDIGTQCYHGEVSSLKPPTLSRGDWFRYADRAERDPRSQCTIVTNSFSHASVHELQDLDWEQEEWSISAALIPLESPFNENGADTLAASSIRAHDLDFKPWWPNVKEFYFGDARHLDGILVWPWLHHRIHRRTNDLLIEPRADFILYHALDKREFPDRPGGTEYVHPLEESVALRTWVEQVAFYSPMPFAEVQRDYLRDYLAARKASLLIAIVADRFANVPTVNQLGLEQVEQELIGEHAWLTTTVHEKAPHNSRYAMGRASLYWNVLIQGYPEPKRSRSAWRYHDESRESAMDGQPFPTFIVDPEGNRCAASKGCPGYLCFSTRVLDRYFTTSGYNAGFHMRTWGGATSPHGSIDIGINSRELLNAFMPDIAKLPVKEQMHWASHSVLPDGEVCWAMFETRMQLNPPHLPGVIDLMADAFNGLIDIVHFRFGIQLAQRVSDLPPGSGRLSVGPIHGDLSEVADLAVPLYAWVIERLLVARLRSLLKAQSVPIKESARQLVLLRLLLTNVAGTAEPEARKILGPLDALNELRSKAAHVAKPDYSALLPRLGLSAMPATPRRYWDALVDAVANSLHQVTERIKLAQL